MLVAAPALALDGEQYHDKNQHDHGDLRRTADVSHVQPDVVDAQRERVHREEVHGADVVQRFHERQRGPGGDGWARHGQGYPKEGRPGTTAQRSAGVQQAHGLLEKGSSAQQVNVGIEHHGHHGDGAAEAADLREPVVGGALPTEQMAETDLHRARVLQQIRINIRDHIGRHRHGQQHCPLEKTAPGESAHGHQPGAGNTHGQNAEGDTQHQSQSRQHISGQHRRDQMRPDVFFGKEREPGNAQYGQRDHQGHQQGGCRPGIESKLRWRSIEAECVRRRGCGQAHVARTSPSPRTRGEEV